MALPPKEGSCTLQKGHWLSVALDYATLCLINFTQGLYCPSDAIVCVSLVCVVHHTYPLY